MNCEVNYKLNKESAHGRFKVHRSVPGSFKEASEHRWWSLLPIRDSNPVTPADAVMSTRHLGIATRSTSEA
jgi:hypothetical protein